MGVYLFSRDVLVEILGQHDSVDFGHEILPAAIRERQVNVYLFRGYWAGRRDGRIVLRGQRHAHAPRAPFNFYDPRRPIFTHPRYLPGSRLNACAVDEAIIAEGCYLDHARVEHSVIGIRTHVYRDARITRSVVLGADYYQSDDEAPAHGEGAVLGIGRRAVLDRVIVDKNACIGDDARLTNEAGVQHADGDGYYIRNGIIIVPRGGTIPPGTVV